MYVCACGDNVAVLYQQTLFLCYRLLLPDINFINSTIELQLTKLMVVYKLTSHSVSTSLVIVLVFNIFRCFDRL